jgi:hypothetical protein
MNTISKETRPHRFRADQQSKNFTYSDKKTGAGRRMSKVQILIVSAINFDGWLDLSRKRFGTVYNFKTAPVIIKTEHRIADRSVLMELKYAGKGCVDKMSASLTRLATWLEKNYTMAEVTAARSNIVWK